MKNIREAFKKLVIMGCHPEDKTYEEADVRCNKANGKEYHYAFNDSARIIGLLITIGRVMQALKNKSKREDGFGYHLSSLKENRNELIGLWQLIKDNGQECTDEDQADETIEKLYQLLK